MLLVKFMKRSVIKYYDTLMRGKIEVLVENTYNKDMGITDKIKCLTKFCTNIVCFLKKIQSISISLEGGNRITNQWVFNKGAREIPR